MPKVLKSCAKSKKLPNLVTLVLTHGLQIPGNWIFTSFTHPHPFLSHSLLLILSKLELNQEFEKFNLIKLRLSHKSFNVWKGLASSKPAKLFLTTNVIVSKHIWEAQYVAQAYLNGEEKKIFCNLVKGFWLRHILMFTKLPSRNE